MPRGYEVPGSPSLRSRRRISPLLSLGLGMIAMLALWTLLSLAVSWWNTTMDDLHYGRPRTFQMDAYVGHNEVGAPSHFIALNYHGRIEIIEVPGGDATHARLYLGPQLYSRQARGNVRDRYDIRAVSRTTNMIEDAAQAPLSVARCSKPCT